LARSESDAALADPHLWLERVEPERANLREAFEYLMGGNDTQTALELAGALGKFWHLRGYSSEGGPALERAVAVDCRATRARAHAVHAAVVLLGGTGTEIAVARATEALELHKKLGDDYGVAYSLFLLGNIAIDRKEWEYARERFTESIEDF